MQNKGPVILIDDDADDHSLTVEVLKDIGVKNPILTFTKCEEAYQYLIASGDEQPFLIISDINLPKLNGIELKKMIDGNPSLRKKSIPFIYYSTSGNKTLVDKAYENNIQGFFLKESSLEKIKTSLAKVIDYWGQSLRPGQ
jgi:CheY-like chemotaxis protein